MHTKDDTILWFERCYFHSRWQHWSVEAMHWVKDVVLKEDASTIHKGNAPENLSIIRNWTMAIFKVNGWKSITTAIRKVANDIDLMIQLLE